MQLLLRTWTITSKSCLLSISFGPQVSFRPQLVSNRQIFLVRDASSFICIRPQVDDLMVSLYKSRQATHSHPGKVSLILEIMCKHGRNPTTQNDFKARNVLFG